MRKSNVICSSVWVVAAQPLKAFSVGNFLIQAWKRCSGKCCSWGLFAVLWVKAHHIRVPWKILVTCWIFTQRFRQHVCYNKQYVYNEIFCHESFTLLIASRFIVLLTYLRVQGSTRASDKLCPAKDACYINTPNGSLVYKLIDVCRNLTGSQELTTFFESQRKLIWKLEWFFHTLEVIISNYDMESWNRYFKGDDRNKMLY